MKRHPSRTRDLAIASASLLPLVCGVMYLLAFWQLAADLGMTLDAGPQGFFAHWQVWIALAVALQLAIQKLSRRLGQAPAAQVTPPDSGSKPAAIRG